MSQKRNLPSWMSSRDLENSKKLKDEDDKLINTESSSSSMEFSKLMEGVMFVLSGFINPERSTLRSQALAMGATYQPDWNSDSTLLICAFPNTPKFRQVETKCGTIVSKEWITECYMQKKLVDIEQYLLHPGKPWRINSVPTREKKEQLSIKSETPSASSKKRAISNSATEVKKWARDDLSQTISWLESQDEKPEQGEIKGIAAQGVLTCLQDAIESLEQKQDIRSVTELWSFVPRVVKELGKIENTVASKVELWKQANSWKKIYEAELAKLGEEEEEEEEEEEGGAKSKETSQVVSGYNSDETIEMTEEEIEVAYRNVSLESL